MIPYINDRLNQWARWCAQGRRVRGLGYPEKVAFYRLAPLPGKAMTPIPDEECYQIEKVIHAMKVEKEVKLLAVINQYYKHTGTAETHARDLRISRATLFNRLHQAHVWVMDRLQD